MTVDTGFPISSVCFRRLRTAPSGLPLLQRWAFATQSEPEMANTKSAKKATRKITARTEVNKSRRSRMRTHVRSVEDAIAGGDKAAAAAALLAAEPEIIRAAQKGVLHRRTASRKVSRLTHQVAKLGQS